MAEQIIDIRERIEKMRIKMDVDQNSELILKKTDNEKIISNENNVNKKIDYEKTMLDEKHKNFIDFNNSEKNENNINSDKPYPSVSLSVKNPISSKTLVVLMVLQIFSNFGILFLLYTLLE